MTLDEIRNECECRESLNLECDGLTRVLSHVLDRQGLPHAIHLGCVIMGDKAFEPHFWIEFEHEGQPYIIDYRARMWLGDNAPHGVFKLSEYPGAEYEGKAISERVSMAMFNILVTSGAWSREIP